MITAVDASRILFLYAELNSGSVTATEKDMFVCDVNRDGKINAADASVCLVFYAEVADGYKDSFVTYLTDVMKIKLK